MNAPEPVVIDAVPEKQTPNQLLARHGSTGRLIVTLQRYAITGWVAFFVLLTVFVLTVVASTLFARKPVLAVDEAGRVLGTFEYLDPTQRSPQEILAAARSFTQNYLSLNSASIDEDYAEAMNMMAEPLFESSLKLVKDGYLARVKRADAAARVVFLEPNGVQLVSRKGLNAIVRLQGVIRVHTGAGTNALTREQPFDLTLTLTAVARTQLSTRGFRVDAIADN